MALKIIGAGFGRTGTLSTQAALNHLGFPCYHMQEVLRRDGHLDFWREVSRTPVGAQHAWETVFADFTAVVDFPASSVWKELMSAYPEAKVLLTFHPKGGDAWYDSTFRTIYFTENTWQFAVLKIFTPFGRKMGEMSHRLIWQRSLQDTMPDRASAIACYERHIEDVKAFVPADRLLVFSADQGWEPLCAFLGVPVPTDDFPNVNDREAFIKSIAGMKRTAGGIVVAIALIAAVLIYGAFRLFF